MQTLSGNVICSELHLCSLTGSPVRLLIGSASKSLLSLLFSTLFIIMSLLSMNTAQARSFPEHVRQGAFSPSAYPAIIINGIQRDVSANLQIRNDQDLIIMPASLSGPDVNILYRENSQKQIERIWILTAEEAQQYEWQKAHNTLRR